MGTRRSMLILVLVAALALMLPATALAHVPDDDYPYKDAAPYNEPAYEWWVDEDGDGRVDLGTDHDELISDDYGYYYRNCTDFVAYRLAMRNDFRLPAGIGDAGTWGVWARRHGYVVDTTPAAGAVALWTGGTYGHVAWVDRVNGDGTVTYEEYNSNHAILGYGRYGSGTCRPDFPTGGYIHFKDIPTAARYATHIVAAKDDTGAQKTSWYVSQDLRRLAIPDVATFNRLKAAGAQVFPALTAEELAQLPEQSDCWAGAGNQLGAQRTLRRGMSLQSGNGSYRLSLQDDGNLVVYDAAGTAKWAAKRADIDYLVFQRDGNAVAYDERPGGAPVAVWQTSTVGRGSVLRLRNSGTLCVLNAAGVDLWSSLDPVTLGESLVQWNLDGKAAKTTWYVSKDLRRLYVPDPATADKLKAAGAPGPKALPGNVLDQLADQKDRWAAAGNSMTRLRTLRRGMVLRSANSFYRLLLDDQGQLALSTAGITVWEAKVSGIDAFAFEPSGNLVGRRNDGSEVWSTGTDGRAKKLVVRNGGYLEVVDANGAVLWSSRGGTPTVTEFPICTAAEDQYSPEVSGDTVVWEDWRNWKTTDGELNGDIYAFNLTAKQEFALCNAAADQSYPDISGDIVVWQDWRYGDGDIFGYDLSSSREFSLCLAADDQWYPRVSGETVIWADNRYQVEADRYIVSKHLASPDETLECLIPRGADIMHLPDFSDGIIVRDVYGRDHDLTNGIYAFDARSRKEITVCAADGNQWSPRIGGGLVVWQDDRNGTWQYPEGPTNSDVYAYDLSQRRGFPVCTVAGNQVGPAASSEFIVWADARNGTTHIYAYDRATKRTFPVCTAPGGQGSPAIDGNTVVWVDFRNGNADIYGAIITR